METNNRQALLFLLLLVVITGGVFFLSQPEEIEWSAPEISTDEDKSLKARYAFQAPKVKKSKQQSRPYHRLTIFDRARSSQGVTVVGINDSEEVLLFSHDGKILNSWPIDSDRSIFLPEDCSLLALHGTIQGAKVEPWKTLLHSARRYHSDGSVQWEYVAKGILHHDVRPLDEDSILVLEQQKVPYRGKKSLPEGFLVKADLARIISGDGNVEWSWSTADAFDHDYCGIRECPSEADIQLSTAELKRHKDWTHANTLTVLPENKHFKAGDKRFKPGNILIHIRNFWMSFIVDRETKEIVWKFPERNEFTDNPELQIRGGHESHMIPAGLPGAGNILIFDNGNNLKRSYSRILEIDPVTRKIIWKYERPGEFYSRTAGSAQRLPNGNTLLSEDLRGRVFEITKNGEIVWELKVPFRTARAKRYEMEVDVCQDQVD